MANYPKKMKDPTEAALSAIQEALNIRDEEEDHAPAPEPLAEEHETAALEHERPPLAPPVFHDDLRAEPIGSRDLRPEVAPPAANDDRQSIGQILQTLQRRPAHTSYFVAAVFSAAWIVGCLALSWAFLSDLTAAMGPGHSMAAVLDGLGAGPI